MSKVNNDPIQISERALEMVMRDVLDCLVEVSLESAYQERSTDFEIVDITPGAIKQHQGQVVADQPEETEIIPFPQRRRATG
ncbi:MAG: hypothetical protein RPU52_05695 [Candidatus Sedimenticola sp. (ex Thyasira tokunagai)]